MREEEGEKEGDLEKYVEGGQERGAKGRGRVEMEGDRGKVRKIEEEEQQGRERGERGESVRGRTMSRLAALQLEVEQVTSQIKF